MLLFHDLPSPRAATTLLISLTGCLVLNAQTAPWKDTHQPTAVRVADLLSRMTLEEKVSQLSNDSPAIPRLDVPAYNWWNEGLHGIARSGVATVFPQAIGMAATWDTGLMHDVGDTISTEARAKNSDALRHDNRSIYYGLTIWSPNINIFRDPRWGRGQETYGEDPYLTSRMGVAFVQGLQGSDPAHLKTVATPKHFAVHSGPEQDRHHFNVPVSAHDLEDTYLPAFRATVTEGHAESVMCAYNAIDGTPACANRQLLQDDLRKKWGFTGYVTSDCGAIQDFYSDKGHHFSKDAAAASAAALQAGTDISCGPEFAEGAVAAVQEGILPVSIINTALGRLLSARFRLGMFDPPASVPYTQIPMSEVDSPEHRALALQTAREAIVLLKNRNHILPLGGDINTIAVVGPNSDSLAAIEGNYNGTPADPALPLESLRKAFPRAHILFAQGATYAGGILVQVPSSVFRVAEDSAESGLHAEYFDNAAFSGKPTLTRVDPSINFDWRGASPAPGVGSTEFSVRWTGTLTPPAAGDIAFHIALAKCGPCDDNEAYTVFVDGKQVAATITNEAEKSHRSNDHTDFTLHFDDVRQHTLRVDYMHYSKMFGAGLILNWLPPAEALRAEAVAAATKADVVVAFVGLSPNLEGEEMSVNAEGFAGGDRTKITLPHTQSSLLDALYATGKPVVVVLLNGSALAIPSAQEQAAAILEAWYPGEAGGTAIADTLTGANNPAGRLPVTFYRSEAQLPAFTDYSMSSRTYRYFRGDPLYPFGYGLSYAEFRYSNVRVSSASINAGEGVTVEADISNSSKVAGDEVAELYVQPPALVTNPVYTLQGYQRLNLKPGETRHIRFMLSPSQLSTVDAAGVRRVRAGEYRVFVGGSLPARGTATGATLRIRSSQ
jgi:beta-glucosidase